ncbi:MAG: peptidylprolyl isomerase [Nitrososphaerales archaeon]
MVDKPRRRKQGGHGRTYLVLGVVLILVAASVSYAYVAGIGPFKAQPASTSTTKTSTVPSLLYARINTSLGSFDVELFNSLTPQTVANFVNLVNQGFYNNLVWHRIDKGFVIQTGDPATRYAGGNRATWGDNNSGVYVPFEHAPSLHNDEYYLGMASTGSGIGGSSQFYINLANNSASLDGKYAVFGKVISGMSVVLAIANVPVEQVTLIGGGTQPEPVTPVYVTSITMISGP